MRPSGSLKLTGLLDEYEYPPTSLGLLGSIKGSTLANLPIAVSYSRAPRCTSPVASWFPPTHPFWCGHDPGGVPRVAPYGVVRRDAMAPLPALIEMLAVPWWSDASKNTPDGVRIATVLPAK